jgi:hypothetical protein
MRSSHTSSITTAAYRLTSKWFVSIGPRLVNSKWVVASLVLSPDRFGIASGRARLEPGIRTDGPAKAGGVLGIASGFPRYRPRLAPDKIRSKAGCLRFEVGQSPDILRIKIMNDKMPATCPVASPDTLGCVFGSVPGIVPGI